MEAPQERALARALLQATGLLSDKPIKPPKPRTVPSFLSSPPRLLLANSLFLHWVLTDQERRVVSRPTVVAPWSLPLSPSPGTKPSFLSFATKKNTHLVFTRNAIPVPETSNEKSVALKLQIMKKTAAAQQQRECAVPESLLAESRRQHCS